MSRWLLYMQKWPLCQLLSHAFIGKVASYESMMGSHLARDFTQMFLVRWGRMLLSPIFSTIGSRSPRRPLEMDCTALPVGGPCDVSRRYISASCISWCRLCRPTPRCWRLSGGPQRFVEAAPSRPSIGFRTAAAPRRTLLRV